jgi:hypothetical protein
VISEATQNGAPKAVLFGQVGYGKIADTTVATNTSISAKGYLSTSSSPANLAVRADTGGTPAATDAVFLSAPGFETKTVYTVFAIGAPAPQALVCTDTSALAMSSFTAACKKSQ